MPARYWIGTSGWVYNHWRGRFYPENLPSGKWLDYFRQHFRTVELNYSFYRLPPEQAWRKWAASVPDDFLFAVKASRYITHVRRLRDCREPIENFLGRARLLGDALGPVLYQLPPNFHNKPENRQRLEEVLSMLPGDLRHVFEFRHDSWFADDIFSLLRLHNAGFCIYHMVDTETPLEATTDFAYVRFHGYDSAYGGNYPEDRLEEWARRLRDLPEDVRRVYAYFNNDAYGYAVANARTLSGLLNPEDT